MSIRVSTETWRESSHRGAELLMLLAISDFANDSGTAFPSVKKLAKMCRVTHRHANRLLAALQDSGELEVRLNQGRRGSNLYVVRPRGNPGPGSNEPPVTPPAALTRQPEKPANPNEAITTIEHIDAVFAELMWEQQD